MALPDLFAAADRVRQGLDNLNGTSTPQVALGAPIPFSELAGTLGGNPLQGGLFDTKTPFNFLSQNGDSFVGALAKPGVFDLANRPSSAGSNADAFWGKVSQGIKDLGKTASKTAANTITQLTDAVTGGAAQFKDAYNAASQATGVPAAVLAAIDDIETGGKFNADARSPYNPGVGYAQGLGQLTDPISQKYGVTDPYDPTQNIMGTAKYIGDLYARYGDWNKAAAAYFGAIDANGNITGATDVGGQTGFGYVSKFNDALSKYQKNEQIFQSQVQSTGTPDGTKQPWQQIAESQLASQTGQPYHWGGKDPTTGFDCSGFVSWVFKNAYGVNLTPQTTSMYAQTAPVAGNPQPGDLVFFNMGEGPHLEHVGIYMGNGQFINDTDWGGHSGVQISNLSDWANQSPQFRRVQGT